MNRKPIFIALLLISMACQTLTPKAEAPISQQLEATLPVSPTPAPTQMPHENEIILPDNLPRETRLMPGEIFHTKTEKFEYGLYVDPQFTGYWREVHVLQEVWAIMEYIDPEKGLYILKWGTIINRDFIPIHVITLEAGTCYWLNDSELKFEIYATEELNIFTYRIGVCTTGEPL